MAKQKRTGAVAAFDKIQAEIRLNPRADSITDSIEMLCLSSLVYLQQLEKKTLTTAIPDKEYFAFLKGPLKSK